MRLIIMFVAIALAAGAFFITTQMVSNRKEQSVPLVKPQVITQQVPTTDVYVANDSIPIGTVIGSEHLNVAAWPKHLVLPDMVEAPSDPSQASNILGTVARTPFEKGEPIIRNKLANAQDPSFLAASLPKGMRVVTVGVDAETGVGGFLFPGDRVDVLVTHDVALGGTEEVTSQMQGAESTKERKLKTDPITEVLLSNIRVMAVNQRSTSKGGEQAPIPTNISLEVSASDAQKIRLVENGNGRISLALRSLKDKDEAELARPTGVGDLSRLTPPAYFSVLYDNAGQPTYLSPEAAEAALDGHPQGIRSAIVVVRGVKVDEVEVMRP